MTVKLNYLIFSLSVLVGVIIRSAMLVFTVDANNGFIRGDHLTAAVVIIVFLCVAGALVLISSLLTKEVENIALKPKDELFGGAAMLMSVIIIYETFLSPLLLYATSVQKLFHYISAVLAAVGFFYIGYCKLSGKAFPKLLSLAPVVYWMVRIITVFTEFSTLATVSDTIVETVSMCLCLLTFLDYAKLECGVSVKNERRVFATSLLCGYVCAIGSVPRLVSGWFVSDGFAYFRTIPAATTLGAALFCIVFAYSLTQSVKTDK